MIRIILKRINKWFIFNLLLGASMLVYYSCDTLLTDDLVSDGKMMFWSNFDGPPIDVFVENQYYGTITTFYGETPDCDSSGCVTVNLEPGTYSFYAEEQASTGQTKTWEGTITVRADACGTLTLTP